MSGVRNLRAMFEQKGDGLPDRGRSPGPGGFEHPSPSASPRPLSKVRTSFVAVEKDGRIGLRREPSEDSVSVSSRKLSNDTDTTIPQLTSERSDIFLDKMSNTAASFKTDLSREAIPESPSHDTPAELSPKKELKSHLGPNANPDKVVDQEEPQTKMLSGNPTATSAARLGGTVFNEGISGALNSTPSTDTKTKAAAPVSTAKNNTGTSKSPLPAKALSGKESTKTMSSSTNAKKAAAAKTAAAKPAPIGLAPSDTGFVKPKPKSPTRPVKLPSSLTTHTAASAQKVGSGNTAPAPRQSLSRASGNSQHLSANPTTHRSPSRNSVLSAGTTTTKALKHKPSNIGRSRPSLGPPPKQETKNQPATRRESHVDEGFLARMMRPTQSSAKKTSEKAPLTPPRKQSAPVKKLDVKDAERNAKKVAAKIQASSTQAKATKDTTMPVAVKEQPTAKEIAPAVAKTESAETAVKEAKVSTDTTDPPVVEDEKVETEPSANDVAVIVAQKEEAEDIIETAKASTDTIVTVDIPSEEELEVAEVQNIPEPAISVSAEVDVSESAAPVPVINDDSPRAEDIEDTIQEPSEPSHQSPSADPTVVSEPEDIPETKASTTSSTEELIPDSQEVVDESAKPNENADESPKLEETVADVEDTASEEAKTEASTIGTPLDGTTDGIEESTTKDTVATTP